MSRKHHKKDEKEQDRKNREQDARLEQDEKQIKQEQKEIERLEHKQHRVRVVRSFKLYQIIGGTMANLIKGVAAGARDKFQALAVPAGSVVTGVPVWASDNPLAVVTASADGLSADVAVDSTATGSFNLSVTSTNPDGSTATGTASVPVLPADTGNAVTSFDISQTA